MKRALLCLLPLALATLVSAQAPAQTPAHTHPQLQGTIVRMRMNDCMAPQHGFMTVMSGAGRMDTGLLCPEYVLLAENVVYVISGKTSDQLLPLAEETRFHFQKNEMLIRVDDAPKESHFHIKAMMLRPEWDRNQKIEQAEANAAVSHLDSAIMRDRQ